MTNKSSSWTLVAQLSPTPEMKLQQNVTQNGLICVRIIMVICLASPGDLCLCFTTLSIPCITVEMAVHQVTLNVLINNYIWYSLRSTLNLLFLN